MKFVLKEITKSKLVSENSFSLAKQEGTLHAKIPPHENIVKMIYSEETADKFVLVLEKCSHGDYLERKLHSVSFWLFVIGLLLEIESDQKLRQTQEMGLLNT